MPWHVRDPHSDLDAKLQTRARRPRLVRLPFPSKISCSHRLASTLSRTAPHMRADVHLRHPPCRACAPRPVQCCRGGGGASPPAASCRWCLRIRWRITERSHRRSASSTPVIACAQPQWRSRCRWRPQLRGSRRMSHCDTTRLGCSCPRTGAARSRRHPILRRTGRRARRVRPPAHIARAHHNPAGHSRASHIRRPTTAVHTGRCHHACIARGRSTQCNPWARTCGHRRCWWIRGTRAARSPPHATRGRSDRALARALRRQATSCSRLRRRRDLSNCASKQAGHNRSQTSLRGTRRRHRRHIAHARSSRSRTFGESSRSCGSLPHRRSGRRHIRRARNRRGLRAPA